MSTPLVSILIRSIARNTLQETLDSVGKQDYPAIEVLVVAAVPDHPPLSKRSDGLQAQLILTDNRLHRSMAANKALELARGEYALILDDDDWIAPKHISNLVQAIQDAPACLVAYSRTQTVDAEGQAGDLPVMGLPYDPLRLLAGNSIPMHSVLFSLRLREMGCRFDEKLDLYEDWDFWLQAAEHTDFLFIPVTTAFYRIHSSSGVHEHVQFHGHASRLIYEKWRNRWTPEQLSLLMERSWQHTDLVQTLNNVRQELETQRMKLHPLETLNTELESRISALEQALQQFKADHVPKAFHEQALNQILNSHSWRLMAPVRHLFNALRNLKAQSRTWLRVLKTAVTALPRLPQLIRQYGVRELTQKVRGELNQGHAYLEWIKTHEPQEGQYPALLESAQTWKHKPLISVLMPTYNSPLNYLREAIQSVQAQVYPNWELCIADDASPRAEVRDYLTQVAQQDPRIVLNFREKNGHISESSNTALYSSKGEWVALLDHDDRLHPMALYWVVHALQDHKDAQIIFSDEDKIDGEGLRFDPYFKGEYNRELMWAQNMISHLGCYKRSTLIEIGGFRTGYEGSQDYDLALRVIERSQPHQIVHVPRVLYHWRAIAGSTALAPDQKPYADSASRRALRDHLERLGISANVEPAPEIPNMNRVRPKLPAVLPLVSVLIPTRDRIELLRTCIESIQKLSTYPNIEIIVIDNNSAEPASLEYFDALAQQGIRVIRDPRPFNFSALNNFAAAHAKGDFLCLMNNDIEIVTPGWLEELLSFAVMPGIGAVGARLWYPGHSGLQHGGVVVGLGGVAGHAHVGLARGHVGYFGRIALHHRLLAVTAACLLIRKSDYLKIGGLDEKLAVAFNDVDFCLRLHKAGLACVYTPYAEMIHHESASRGNDLSDDQRDRFMSEEQFMHQRWGTALVNDPFFSPNLSLQHPDFRPAHRSRAPQHS